MNQALEAAQADTPFQFFLARLFGRYITAVDGQTQVHGYEWRGQLYVKSLTKATPQPSPSSDSQHRSSPDF